MSGRPTEVHESTSAEQTAALGARIAARLASGDIVRVHGELGSGKTTLVRGAAAALGVRAPVTSPTFAIGHRYEGRDGLLVCHLDLYRLGDEASETPGLLDDYVGEDCISFVEWPPAGYGGDARLDIELVHAGGDRRRIEVRE